MMRKYSLLLKMQLYNAFGINRMLHSHDTKEKKQFFIVGIAGISVIGIFMYLSGYISFTLAEIGLIEVLPTLMLVSYSLFILFLTFLKGGSCLIGLKDYDMVVSLPVSNTVVILSRLTSLYAVNLMIGIVAIAPMMIVYGVCGSLTWETHLILFVSLIIAPIIPMIVALAIGVLISCVSSHSKHSNIFSLLFSVMGILLFIFAVSQMQTMQAKQVTNVSLMFMGLINQYYLPAFLFAKALVYTDFLSLLSFVVLSVVIAIAFVIVISYFYKKINTIAFSHYTKKNFCLEKVKVSSSFGALYKKELKRFFSCTIYALNSSIVIILLLVASTFTLFGMQDMIVKQLEAMGIISIFQTVLPLIIAMLVSINCTTSASLSLEGKSRWLMCSAPVEAKTILQSKIAVNLTVVLPILWVSMIFLRIVFPLSILETVLLFITPTIYTFFIAVIGMWLNIKFPRYDWTSEYYAIKGGAVSVLASIGVGVVCSVIPLYLCIFFQKQAQLIIITANCLVLLGTTAIYQRLCHIRLYM